MKNSKPTPAAISEWYLLKDNQPTIVDVPILVYWEDSDGECNLKSDFDYCDGRLLDGGYEPVTDKHILETAIWCYWSDPMQNNSNKEAMKSTQSTTGIYIPQKGDVFEWEGHLLLCIEGGGKSGTVVQIGQNHYIKGFHWIIGDAISVFVRKATEQEMEMYFGEQPETPAPSAGNILTDELTKDQQEQVLRKLFGADYAEHLIFDSKGNEFYATPDNLAFDLTTLSGIISYIRHTEYQKGYDKCQQDMRKVLGV